MTLIDQRPVEVQMRLIPGHWEGDLIIGKGISLSQDELGAKSGYHRTYIGQLERGEKSPSLRTLFNLAATLEASPADIVKQVERVVMSR